MYQLHSGHSKAQHSISGYHSNTQDAAKSLGGQDLENSLTSNPRAMDFESTSPAEVNAMIQRGAFNSFHLAPSFQPPRYNVTSHGHQRPTTNDSFAGYKIGGNNWV